MDFVATYILGHSVSLTTRKRGDMEKWRVVASLCGMDARSCSVASDVLGEVVGYVGRWGKRLIPRPTCVHALHLPGG